MKKTTKKVRFLERNLPNLNQKQLLVVKKTLLEDPTNQNFSQAQEFLNRFHCVILLSQQFD